jgi:hypothetical protein
LTFELYVRVAQAWELRHSPYIVDAIATVLDAYDRAPLTWFEECEQRRVRNLQLIRLLRETDVLCTRAEAA